MSILDSIVVKFGEEDAAAAGVSFKVALDDQLNGYDDEGKAKTEFYPGDDCYLLVQLPVGYYIDRITYTSGEVTQLGSVTRTETEEKKFFPDDEEVTAVWRPSSSITAANFYGRESTFSTTEDKMQCLSPPVICDVSYSFLAESLLLIHPTGLELGVDEEWPIGVVIWAKQ